MIRLARSTDVDDIATLGLEFAEKSKAAHTFEPSLGKIWEGAYQIVGLDNAIVLVSDVDGIIEGFIFGLILSPLFSEDEVLQEMAFYARSNKGGIQLFTAFEREASIRGIRKIVVGYKPDFCDLSKLYKRSGYKLMELQFIKEL